MVRNRGHTGPFSEHRGWRLRLACLAGTDAVAVPEPPPCMRLIVYAREDLSIPQLTLYETCCTRAHQSRPNGSVSAEPRPAMAYDPSALLQRSSGRKLVLDDLSNSGPAVRR